MNILVAGIHGVGKTYLAERIPEALDLHHTSASKLIKEQLNDANWGVEKLVSDIERNQRALSEAVSRHNSTGRRFLLDGHFVLLNSAGDFVRLQEQTFDSLRLDGVILIEAEPSVIAKRIAARDGRTVDEEDLRNFAKLERSQAERICAKLGFSLIILNSPDSADFNDAVVRLLLRK